VTWACGGPGDTSTAGTAAALSSPGTSLLLGNGTQPMRPPMLWLRAQVGRRATRMPCQVSSAIGATWTAGGKAIPRKPP